MVIAKQFIDGNAKLFGHRVTDVLVYAVAVDGARELVLRAGAKAFGDTQSQLGFRDAARYEVNVDKFWSHCYVTFQSIS